MRYALAVTLLLVGCSSYRAEKANERAKALEKAGDFKGAAAEMASAVQAVPDSAKYHYNFGIVLSRRGLYDQAAMEFRTALQLDPSYAKASQALTVVEMRIADRFRP